MKPKFPIPGRERQREADARKSLISHDYWYKKAWPWITTTVVLLGWILVNGVSVIQSAEQLPAAYVKTRNALLASYYDDASWTGVWSNHPEGYVDSGDVNLSAVDVLLQLQTSQGTVDGTIATKKLCTQLPFAIDGVLVRGEVKDGLIRGIAYDYIGGKEVKLASLIIERSPRDFSILKVHMVEDALEVFPVQATIRRDPNAKPMYIQSKQGPYCEGAHYPNGRAPTSKKRKSVSELRHTPLPSQ